LGEVAVLGMVAVLSVRFLKEGRCVRSGGRSGRWESDWVLPVAWLSPV
jgi:hypothetical protein